MDSINNKFPAAAHILFAFILVEALGKYVYKSLTNLFLRNKLDFSTSQATSISHATGMANAFFMPLGALVVSSYMNRYKIIVIGTFIALVARIILSIGSLPKLRYRIFMYIFWIFEGSSFVILAGAVNAFGGDQFKLPEQHDLLVNFYSWIFIMHNISIMTAYCIGPLIKTEIACLGEQDCYFVSFAISALLSILEIIVLISTTKYFVKKKPTDRIILKFVMCIGNALKQWIRERKINPKPNWMDHAEPAYGAQLVADIKKYFEMLIIISTFPVFWSVFNQKNTKWLFQATRMDGRLGQYTIIPDHYQLLNPLLVVIFMPLVTKVMDPLTKSLSMDRVMRRIIVGGLIVSASFVAAGFLESRMKLTYPKIINNDECEVRFLNNCNCSIFIKSPDILETVLEIYPYSISTIKHVPVTNAKSITFSGKGSCTNLEDETMEIIGGQALSVFIQDIDGKASIRTYEEIIKKTESGFPMLSVVGGNLSDSVFLRDSKNVKIPVEAKSLSEPKRSEVVPEIYDLFVGNKIVLTDFPMYLGGVYVAMVSENDAKIFESVQPNSVHIFWIIPQTLMLTIGEIYWQVALMDFIYTEAPLPLKQVVSATSVFADGLGDGIIAAVTAFTKLDQDYEFYASALAVALDMCLLLVLALRFKPTYPDKKLI